VTITKALNELWPRGRFSQQEIADKLTAAGLPTDQTKVSAWLRYRVPEPDQLAAIEDAYEIPRGWLLYRAGFIDLPGLTKAVEDVGDRTEILDALRAAVEDSRQAQKPRTRARPTRQR
jgi:hypothetical protein